MSNVAYPRLMPPEWRERESFGKQEIRCNRCLDTITKGQRLVVLTIQTGWMRGDDDVELLCEKCGIANGYTPPPTKASTVTGAFSLSWSACPAEPMSTATKSRGELQRS